MEDHEKTLAQLGLADWNRIDLKPERPNNLILVWKPQDNGIDGFEFFCLGWVSEDDEIYYAVLFRGSALFDGVRHLYMGDEYTDNYGYLYYPDLPELVVCLQALDKLQVEHCWDVRDQRKTKET